MKKLIDLIQELEISGASLIEVMLTVYFYDKILNNKREELLSLFRERNVHRRK